MSGCEFCAQCGADIERLNAEILRWLVRHVRMWQLGRELPINVRGELGEEWFDRLCEMIDTSVEHLGGWDAAEPLIDARLGELKRMPYAEYLRSPEWADTRRIAVDHAGRCCQLCNKPGRLDVHHRTYERRGNECLTDLIALCRGCHTNFHMNPGADASQVAGVRIVPRTPRRDADRS